MDGNVQEEQHPRKIGRLQRGYKVYVLLLLMLLYLVNQMDRFVLGVEYTLTNFHAHCVTICLHLFSILVSR